MDISMYRGMLQRLNKDICETIIELLELDYTIDLYKHKKEYNKLQKICNAYKIMTSDHFSFDKCVHCDKWIIEDISEVHPNRLLMCSDIDEELELTDDNYQQYREHIIHSCQGCSSLVCFKHAVYHSVDLEFPQHENYYCFTCYKEMNKILQK